MHQLTNTLLSGDSSSGEMPPAEDVEKMERTHTREGQRSSQTGGLAASARSQTSAQDDDAVEGQQR